MTRAKAEPSATFPLPTSGGSYLREADGSLTLVPDGEETMPAPTDELTTAPADTPNEKEA
jgi:hypothetical protein